MWSCRERLIGKPELVEFPTAEPILARHRITLVVQQVSCLSRREFHRLAPSVGASHWWLKHIVHGFAAVDLPRGDRPFSRRLLLPAGHYTLGVGRGDERRRIDFDVDGDDTIVI